MSSPVSKRRRIDRDKGNDEAVKVIERDSSDIRSSLQGLHSSLEELADVVVVVKGEQSSAEFLCVRALLASASRPLRAMLYGPMRATTTGTADELPRLQLSLTEPWCFKHLVHYIHGLHIRALTRPLAHPTPPPAPTPVVRSPQPRARSHVGPYAALFPPCVEVGTALPPLHPPRACRLAALDIDTAVQLHHVADYYEVLPLRDHCCEFLLGVLSSRNCCTLLWRSQEVNCEPLSQRCHDMLTLDFVEGDFH